MNPTKSISLKQESAETSINVKQGEIFQILIEGAPSTGYSWYLKNKDELIKSKITPLNLNEYNSVEWIGNPHKKGMVGYGGNFNFLFKLENNSNLPKIILEYFRSFEPDNIVAHVEVTVNVEN